MKWLPVVALIVGGMALLLRPHGVTMIGLDQATLAKLLVGCALTAFIGTSVLSGHRSRLLSIARTLAVSCLLTMAVTGFYYSSEVSSIAYRIGTELLPPGDVQDLEPKRTGRRAVRIRRRPDGHFVARMNVNQARITMLVDTGASTIVLKASDARRLGLSMDHLAYTVPVQTANGLAYSAAVSIHEIGIGPIVLNRVEALIAQPGTLKESLLGISFLRRLKAYEFSGDYLTLRG